MKEGFIKFWDNSTPHVFQSVTNIFKRFFFVTGLTAGGGIVWLSAVWRLKKTLSGTIYICGWKNWESQGSLQMHIFSCGSKF